MYIIVYYIGVNNSGDFDLPGPRGLKPPWNHGHQGRYGVQGLGRPYLRVQGGYPASGGSGVGGLGDLLA